YPQDIERTVEESHPALKPGAGAAFSIEDEREERLVVVQEIRRDRTSEAEAAAHQIRRAVAGAHELEAHVIVVVRSGDIPKPSSGKIRRNECRDRYLAGRLNVVFEWKRILEPDLAQPDQAPVSFTVADIASWLLQRIARRSGASVSQDDGQRPVLYFGLGS